MFKSQINRKLDAEILYLLTELETHRGDPEKYAEHVERISKLEKLRSEGLQPPSVDVILSVAANIFGILWVARYEQSEVIKAPNAFRMILRPR
jgi:hypothetical protein